MGQRDLAAFIRAAFFGGRQEVEQEGMRHLDIQSRGLAPCPAWRGRAPRAPANWRPAPRTALARRRRGGGGSAAS